MMVARGVAGTILSLLAALLPLPVLASGATLGSVPPYCPSGANPHHVNPAGGSWLGRGPVQAISLWHGPQGVLPVGGKQKPGYPQKVLWLVKRSLHQDVTLRGWNLRTGVPISFELSQGPSSQQVVTTAPLLNWRHPGAVNNAPAYRPWRDYPSELYIPAAGCYVLYAQWRAGGWVVPFSAGA